LHHFAVVKEGTRLLEYIDGVLTGTDTGPSAGTTNAQNLQMGGLTSGTATNFGQLTGIVDEVRLYNRAISAAEVRAIVSGGPTGTYEQSAGQTLLAGGTLGKPLLFDNFNVETAQWVPELQPVCNWNVTRGTVDLLGNGYYDGLPGNGLFVDLDGSTSSAGRLESAQTFTLTPGTYQLKYQLANSNLDANTVHVTLEACTTRSLHGCLAIPWRWRHFRARSPSCIDYGEARLRSLRR